MPTQPADPKIDGLIGERIRTARKISGLTQQDLAKSLNISYQQVQKYERGTNRISVARLAAISQKLNTPMDVFLKDIGTSKEG